QGAVADDLCALAMMRGGSPRFNRRRAARTSPLCIHARAGFEEGLGKRTQPHAEGARIDLVIYPGAYHGFNFPRLQPGISFLGHWLEYDEHAAADAWHKVSAFLGQNLVKAP